MDTCNDFLLLVMLIEKKQTTSESVANFVITGKVFVRNVNIRTRKRAWSS